MSEPEIVRALRLLNLVVALAGVPGSLALLQASMVMRHGRVADPVEAWWHNRAARAYCIIGVGMTCMSAGYAVLFLWLLGGHAPLSWAPSVWMALVNSILVLGVYALLLSASRRGEQGKDN